MRRIIVLLIVCLLGCSSSISSVESSVSEEKTDEEVIVEESIEVSVEEVKEPVVTSLSLVMTGDGLLHGAVYKDAYRKGNGSYEFSGMFENLVDTIAEFDLAYYNQETIFGGEENGGYSGYPQFNSPSEFGDDMIELGFNLVSLANNHSLDRGEAGILHSLNYWKQQENVVTAGCNESFEQQNTINVYECNGITYTFLSYTYGCNGLTAPDGKEYLVNMIDEDKIVSDITYAKDNSDIVLVCMHWGVEYTHEPNEEQERLAKLCADAGATIVLGDHPHVIQPVEWIDDTLVIYSFGNFISAQDELPRNIGSLIGIDIVKTDIDGEVTISLENLRADLVFTDYDSHWANFKLYLSEQLSDDILSNSDEIMDEYWNIIVNRESNIHRGLIME